MRPYSYAITTLCVLLSLPLRALANDTYPIVISQDGGQHVLLGTAEFAQKFGSRWSQDGPVVQSGETLIFTGYMRNWITDASSGLSSETGPWRHVTVTLAKDAQGRWFATFNNGQGDTISLYPNLTEGTGGQTFVFDAAVNDTETHPISNKLRGFQTASSTYTDQYWVVTIGWKSLVGDIAGSTPTTQPSSTTQPTTTHWNTLKSTLSNYAPTLPTIGDDQDASFDISLPWAYGTSPFEYDLGRGSNATGTPIVTTIRTGLRSALVCLFTFLFIRQVFRDIRDY